MSEFERSVPNSTGIGPQFDSSVPIRQGSVPNSTAPVPNSTATSTYSRDRYLFRRSPIRILRYLFRAPVPGVCRHIHMYRPFLESRKGFESAECDTIYTIYISRCTQTAEPFSWFPCNTMRMYTNILMWSDVFREQFPIQRWKVPSE